MPNKVLIGVACAGALLVGLVLGTLFGGDLSVGAFGGSGAAVAAPVANRDYCELYLTTLASNLNTDVAGLERANLKALEHTIQAAYADGRITHSQETALLDKASRLAAHPCEAVDRFMTMHQQFAAAHEAILSAVAAKLNMKPATLQADLASGQTIPEIAKAQNVPLQDVNTAYLDAVRGQLQAAVGAHTITQSQADQAYSAVQRAVASGKYPLLGPHHDEGPYHD
jgi:hypothetical protein